MAVGRPPVASRPPRRSQTQARRRRGCDQARGQPRHPVACGDAAAVAERASRKAPSASSGRSNSADTCSWRSTRRRLRRRCSRRADDAACLAVERRAELVAVVLLLHPRNRAPAPLASGGAARRSARRARLQDDLVQRAKSENSIACRSQRRTMATARRARSRVRQRRPTRATHAPSPRRVARQRCRGRGREAIVRRRRCHRCVHALPSADTSARDGGARSAPAQLADVDRARPREPEPRAVARARTEPRARAPADGRPAGRRGHKARKAKQINTPQKAPRNGAADQRATVEGAGPICLR